MAQIIAGILEFKKGNTFGMTAFTSYGCFWLSLVFLIVAPSMGIGTATEPVAMGWYLLMWGIFTLLMFFGTLNSNRILQFVFGSLALLFFLLALGDFTGMKTITIIAGFEGIICGLSAIYLVTAQVLNESMEKEELPVWAVQK